MRRQRLRFPRCGRPDAGVQPGYDGSKVTRFATAPVTDTISTNWRTIIQLPAVPAAEISEITAQSICVAARIRYAQLPGVAQAGVLSVIVIRAGTVYLVIDPTQQNGETSSGGPSIPSGLR